MPLWERLIILAWTLATLTWAGARLGIAYHEARERYRQRAREAEATRRTRRTARRRRRRPMRR